MEEGGESNGLWWALMPLDSWAYDSEWTKMANTRYQFGHARMLCGRRVYTRAITHWRLVRSNEGKKQKQMGRSRRRKPLFRKWISFISACGFVWIGSCAKKTAISGCFQSGRCSRGNRIALLPWAFGLPSSENILLRPDPAKFSTLCPPR